MRAHVQMLASVRSFVPVGTSAREYGKCTFGYIYLFIYLLNIFEQGRTHRQNHCFTMLPLC